MIHESSRLLNSNLRVYFEIARVDHWFKNIFMIFGLVFAVFHNPDLVNSVLQLKLIIAVIATCLVASSNYVLNEIQDARYDIYHPQKRNRPIPSGRMRISIAYGEWFVLLLAGLLLAWSVNPPFFYTMLVFFTMGILYNVRPFRLKDITYIDVLSESLNNPLRLLLGWFAILPHQFPSISLLLSFWLIGAFFMTSKRFAEYKHINDRQVASDYRKSFRHYCDKKLLLSMFYYATGFSLFFGLFIIKYHIELILISPFVVGFICYYVNVCFKENSAAQNPERLFKERGLMIYASLCLILFIVLLFIDIPIMYRWLHVQPPKVTPLWIIKY